MARNVEFEGCDWHSEGYQTSIPFSKAIDINGDCILAWAMNDEELHPDHGYPLRILIPGFTGARSCKWLRRISVQTDETMHPMHHKYVHAQKRCAHVCMHDIRDLPHMSTHMSMFAQGTTRFSRRTSYRRQIT